MMQQTDMNRGDFRSAGEDMRRAAAEERHKNERLARQLSREAMSQWQRSIEGLLAMPTATALGLASSTLYIAAFIERGFEMIQQSTEALRIGAEQTRRSIERTSADAERTGDGGRTQGESRSEARGENRGEMRA